MANSPHTLGSDSIRSLLLRYAIPSIIGMTAMSLYNLMDSIFIGYGVGDKALAGLAVTFPFMNLAAAFGALVGVGAGAVVSVKLGQRDLRTAELALGNVVLLNVTIGSVFTIVSLLFLDGILTFFGASEVSLPYAREYMQVILLGNIVTHVYMGLNDVTRASGYPQRAMAATLTAVVINAGFNSLFIFGLGMGIRGAALGTICAQSVALAFLLVHYTRPQTYLRFRLHAFRYSLKMVRSIIGIGCSPFFINLCACMVVTLINQGLMRYGNDHYVGAYGINNRILFIFIMIVMGLNQGMQPIVGYNYGAGQMRRVVRAYKATVICATAVMTVCFVLCEFFPHLVIAMVTDNDTYRDIGSRGLRIMAAMTPLVGFQVVSVSFFQSIGKAHKAIFMSLSRQLLLLVPLLLTLPTHYGTDGVWISLPVADFLSVVLATVLVTGQIRKLRKEY